MTSIFVPTTAPTMSTRALDAITVVEAATMFGLPIPFHVSFGQHDLRAQVRTWDEIVTWAEHMDADIVRGGTHHDGRQHLTASGYVAGARVTVSAIAHDGSKQ